jgi:4-phospho-D-threonate 3-dehydrogenase / 4-phospho-D-erythronate 3-dehydrogenase
MTRPRIGVTVGDPAGIGPEIARRRWRPRAWRVCEPVLYGPSRGGAGALHAGAVSAEAGAPRTTRSAGGGRRAGGRHRRGGDGPDQQGGVRAAGLPWKGHTDLLAHLTGAPRVAMMFYSEPLRVVLATVHVPLARCRGC